MKTITQEWLNFAEADLQTCKEIIENEFLTNIVAFHAQQTVEKCFKAIIEENNLKVQKIHSLIRLHKQIKKIVNFEIDKEKMTLTDKVYIKTRYPGDMGMLPDGKPSKKEAKQLYNFADDIYQKTIKLLANNDKKSDNYEIFKTIL